LIDRIIKVVYLDKIISHSLATIEVIIKLNLSILLQNELELCGKYKDLLVKIFKISNTIIIQRYNLNGDTD
jgi:hypothetical protein